MPSAMPLPTHQHTPQSTVKPPIAPRYSDGKSADKGVMRLNLVALILPLIGTIGAITHGIMYGFNPYAVGIFVLFYVLTVLGITVGFHRLLTHRAFETPNAVRYCFAALGSMAVQGPVLKWVALHRCHHQHSDTDQDVHSPNTQDKTFLGSVRGAWHAHMGWFFMADPDDLDNYNKDLRRDPIICKINDQFTFWVFMGMLLPTLMGWALIGGLQGALLGFVWGGLTRLFMVHHVTWSINSICHIWGARTYETSDKSRNNWLFGILALGEGWHNNHHAFPASARHGLKWWQIDVSYIVIKSLSMLGLAKKLRLPLPGQTPA